tara:strand:+ start:3287 stop:4297 length:1011 start_codon:yes stop_codon:yes gene_type:complete
MLNKINQKNILYSLIILFILSLFLLILLELGSRSYSFFVKKNKCANSLNIEKYESEFNENLGYVPLPGKKIGCFREEYNISESGFREYPNFDQNSSNILLIGDSFGFGDEVNDDETISHYLKKNHKIDTLNAAVYGYGLDQAFLRAKNLEKLHSYNEIYLIIAPGGYSRTNVVERNGISKPYFNISNGKLKLIKPKKKNFKYASRSRLVEKSLLFNFIANKINLTNIIVKEKYNENDPVLIGCKITEYFNNYFFEKDINLKVIFYRDASEIFIKNSKNFKKTNKYLECLDKAKVKYIDTLGLLKNNIDKKLYVKNTYGHPTAYSNEKVAELIFNEF